MCHEKTIVPTSYYEIRYSTHVYLDTGQGHMLIRFGPTIYALELIHSVAKKREL